MMLPKTTAKTRGLVLAAATGIICGAVASNATETRPGTVNLYAKTVICTGVYPATDTVLSVDCNGTRWSFSGVQDFEEGDLIALVMSDNGTPETIYDDPVLCATYAGGTELLEREYESVLMEKEVLHK